MGKITVKTKTTMTVEVPRVPNFVQANGNTLSVAELSDEDIDILGAMWIIKFKENARKKR